MRERIFLMVLLLIAGCTNNQPEDAPVVIEKFDSLANTPVVEGYKPEHKIEFSHTIHSELKLTNDCAFCHKNPGRKVELDICAICHEIKSSFNKYDYYVRLDSISTFIQRMKTDRSLK